MLLIPTDPPRPRPRPKIRVSDVLLPGQKWITENLEEEILIDKVNDGNGTFAAFYVINRVPTTAFPCRGEYDKEGSTIGWASAFQNSARNDHATGVWVGSVESIGESLSIVTTRLISYGNAANTTVSFNRFRLEQI